MTLRELKQWISQRRCRRRSDRRGLAQAFHFEQLEARTLLSATIGTLPVDVEAGSAVAMAPWESVAPIRSWGMNESADVLVEHQWEDRPAHAIDVALRPEAPPNRPPMGLYFNGPTAPSHVYVLIIFRPPLQPQAAQWPSKDQPQKSTAPGGLFDETGVNEDTRGPLFLR